MDEPNLILLAGPNGAGKSTVAPDLLRGALHVDEFVNADVIARGLSAFHPEGAAIEAGRAMLTRLRELTVQRRNVAFESTLASRTFAPWETIRRRHAVGLRNFFQLYGPIAKS
jgi:predicted ABC-type ATPase